MDLFFFTNLFEQTLKVKFLSHPFFKSNLYSVDVSIPCVTHKQGKVFSLTSFKLEKNVQLIFYIRWRFRAGQALHGEIAFLATVEASRSL